jgi:hypothetical protein
MLAASGLAVAPVLGTFPDARLLLASQVGFTAGVGALTWHAITALRAEPRSLRRWTVAGALCVLVLTHASSSAVVGKIQVDVGSVLPSVVRSSILGPPFDDATIGGVDVLLLGAADPTTTIYLSMLRRTHGRPAPASCHLLTAGYVPHLLRRESHTTFTLERVATRLTVGDLYSSAFSSEPPAVGVSVDLGALHATALEVRDGLWRKARFEHSRSLDDPSLFMLVQTYQGLLRLSPPPIGGELWVPAPFPPLGLLPQVRGAR